MGPTAAAGRGDGGLGLGPWFGGRLLGGSAEPEPGSSEPSMVHEIVGDLFLVIHRARPPRDAEWAQYLASWKPLDMARMRTLVFTDGGGPNSSQRRAANAALGGKPSLTAVVSSSPLVRGIVKSLSWFNPKIEAFQPEEAERAFRYLGARTPDQVRQIWEHVGRLCMRLGDVSLRSLRRRPVYASSLAEEESGGSPVSPRTS